MPTKDTDHDVTVDAATDTKVKPPKPPADPYEALLASLHNFVACLRACTCVPETDAMIVDGGVLLADGHHELAWQRLGAAYRTVLAEKAAS